MCSPTIMVGVTMGEDYVFDVCGIQAKLRHTGQEYRVDLVPEARVDQDNPI